MSDKIENGKVVSLAYSLKDSDGKLMDRADSKDPFMYMHGAHQIVPGLEGALEGLNVGDKKSVEVSPRDGYGEKNPALKLTVNKSQFPDTVELESGMQFEAHSADGQSVIFTVESIEGDKVHIDGNHPLAGQTLHFDVEVLGIRQATEEETAHGHAHSGDGHEHH
ncbi:MAG TPA: peptidylprolyl isomerase [Bdellovibrionota bacterium]|nr:peptidylprolyl isomerase [Bdellovibrionota bacterium]